MAYRHAAQNFSKGVLTEELWGRSDIAPYNAAVRQGKNVVVLKYGGLQKRCGTRFVYEIKDGPSKLFPFEGAYDASYAMVMGQATMRLAALGGMVIEEQLTVEGLVLNNPVEVTASFHGFVTGDEVYFNGVEGADELNGLILTVTVLDEHRFTIPIDGGIVSPLTEDNGGIVRVSAPPALPDPPDVPPPADPPPSPGIGGGGGGNGYNGGGQFGGGVGEEMP